MDRKAHFLTFESPVSFSVITPRIDFVTYRPIYFINTVVGMQGVAKLYQMKQRKYVIDLNI